MPAFGTHIGGPVKQKLLKRRQNNRSWFGDLPIGMNDPDYVHYLNDFKTTADYTSGDWTLTEVGTGSQAISTSATAGVNGIMVLTTGGTTGNSENLQNSIYSAKCDATLTANTHTLQSFKRTWFEASVAMSNVATCDMFVGLSISNTTLGTPTECAGFTMTTGGATVSCISALASTVTTISAETGGSTNAFSATAATYMTLGFVFDSANSIHYYINRNFIGTSTTNLPAAALSPAFYIETHSGNARTLSIDYFYWTKNR
jgi:hypothetical protein